MEMFSKNIEEQNRQLRTSVTSLWKINQMQKAKIAELENLLRDYINELMQV